MSVVIAGLLYGWKKNKDYGLRLLSDLTDDQMVAQPVSQPVPMNHPAWVFCHLNVYLPIIAAIIQNQEFEDPKPHRYGMQSRPELDRGAYPSKEAIVAAFGQGHDQVTSLLEASDDSVLNLDVKLPRWRELMPKAGIALPYLMLLHENQHLGQVSAWRRAAGLPSV